MNVDKRFQTLTEADCRKRYPKGYFATVEKNIKGGGIVLFVMGVIAAPIGLWLLLLLGKSFFQEGLEDLPRMTAGDITGMIFIFLIPLLILAFGVFCLWLGIRRIRRNGDEWFRFLVENSGYTEREVEEFGRQASSPGNMVVTLTEKGQPGAILTEDYFLLEPGMPMKFSDIKGAYLVSYPETIYNGKAIKTIQRMNLAVFSTHWTFQRAHAKPEVAQRLQAMLLEKNPGIDTADGRVLNDREYDEMEKECIEKRKSRNAQDGRS